MGGVGQGDRLGFALTHHRALCWLSHISSLRHSGPVGPPQVCEDREQMELGLQPHLERQNSLKTAGCYLLPCKL